MIESLRVTSVRTDTPNWSCNHCQDRGYNEGSISYQQYGTSEVHFCTECQRGRQMFQIWIKKPKQQDYCKRIKQEKIDRAFRLSGVSGMFKRKRLTDLESNKTLHKECQKYVENWETMKNNGFGFYFWGNVGAGKTHTATALANELMEKQMVEVLFLSLPATVARVKKTFDSEVKTADSELFERMKHVELLVLDDMGVEKLSDWLEDEIYQLIDHRWKNQKPMIITSNQSLDDLYKHYKPQIASRIWSCCKAIKFSNRDRRKVKSVF